MKKRWIIIGIIFTTLCLMSVATSAIRSGGSEDKILIEKCVAGYELNNYEIRSSVQLDNGHKLLSNNRPKIEMLALVPNLKIQFKQKLHYSGYVMDKQGNIFSKLSTFPLNADYGDKALFYWPNASGWGDDEYYFYIELGNNDIKILSIIFPSIKMPKKSMKKGFYVYSPPNGVLTEGLDYCFTYNRKPVIAWLDTENKNVIKYQLFDSQVKIDPNIRPIIDQINPSEKTVALPKELPLSEENARNQGDMGMGEYSFVVRAIFKDGSYKDTEPSGPLLIEKNNAKIITINETKL